MGIQGLLPFLKEIQRDIHVSSFRGRRVAVDSYCWLHKGAYSCALQLVMKTDKLETLPFIKYCMKRVNMLLNHDITPVMVFDGGYLPLKANTEKDRRERRQVNRDRGKALLKEGKKSQAVDCFQKSVDVSPEMALALIKECRSVGVECIVAPYEADSQLAYLSKESLVDLVITEDSDLLVFGCKKVMFKLDDSGNGRLIETDRLGKANRGLVGFTVDSFRHMCILSGCDYLPSVPGIGLGKALKLMKRFNKDPYRVIKALHYENGKVPKEYEANFCKADQTFLYQMVFDPRTQEQVRLNTLPEDVEPANFEFAGVASSPRKAVGMARGNINPFNHAVMDTYSPSKAPPPKFRSWSGSVMRGGGGGGGGGWGHTTALQQPPSSLTSSDSSRKYFKPPKRHRPKPVSEDVDCVKDEDLQTMYLTASMTTAATNTTAATTNTTSTTTATTTSPPPEEPSLSAHTDTEAICAGNGRSEKQSPAKPTQKSRFFSGQACHEGGSSEETPSDVDDVSGRLRARRHLSLLPPATGPLGGGTEPLPPPYDDNGGVEDSSKSDEEMMEERCKLRRKRLNSYSSDTRHGVRTQLQGFVYSNSATKKARLTSSDTSPLSQLEEDSPVFNAASPPDDDITTHTGTPPRVKNPFAKSLMSPRKVAFSRDYGVVAGEAGTTGMAAVENGTSVDSSPHRDSDDISSDSHEGGLGSTTGSKATRPTCRSFMTSQDYITTRPRTTFLSHFVSLASSNTAGPAESHSLDHSSTNLQEKMSLGSTGKRRGGTKAKSRAGVFSKFKPPKRKQSSEPGLIQLNLHRQFEYCSRPQMSREQ